MTRPAAGAKTGSMRQILNMPSTPGYRNAYTCGFSAQKGRRAHGFRNLPHTSDGRFRKCGENRDRPTRPRFYASATCGFVAENLIVLGVFRFFPHTSGERSNTERPEAENATNSAGKTTSYTQKPPFGGFHGPSRTYRRKASSKIDYKEKPSPDQP